MLGGELFSVIICIYFNKIQEVLSEHLMLLWKFIASRKVVDYLEIVGD
jgi:hypothetical protein